ncbi:molybdopterin biosynthesis protein MoeA [Komagataeibacter xylinus NBRC 13693]|uniref:Molybdopterin molybdenumtransferase n=1 Tax=Komagataeibacter xylinus NBRC 13693 TaxID=1234668 RepID=A0A0D6Q942_KOMXY|nr:molybdopterin molybdotransferase MoeA [Komagataeibacter xylinus]GAN99954.1 molybdopterin biosynthesis protein MoeA [Komagataeibacter xylinus NBRC 13693]
MKTNSFARQVDYATALRLVRDRAARVMPSATRVPVAQATGRVAAADIMARTCRPPADISAMDGYAFAHDAMVAHGRLPVAGRTVAGDAAIPLAPGHARAILTGARIPAGADCVMAAERMAVVDGTVAPAAPLPASGANIRRQGEEFASCTRLVAAGQRLDWRHVALLSSQGVGDVAVIRRPRVSVVSNGAELAADAPGACPDSNAPMLASMLTGIGARVTTHAAPTDNVARQAACLHAARCGADVMVTTGGISVGDTDHMLDILRDAGARVMFRGVAIRPGRPLTVLEHDGQTIFCLPGNPGAAAICALMFVWPYLRTIMGQDMPWPGVCATADFTADAPPGVTLFIPVSLHPGPQGWLCRRVPTVGASDIIAFSRADALLAVTQDSPIRAGQPAWGMPLRADM